MGYRYRPLLPSSSNAGLAQLSGAAGRGFERAGNAIANLGKTYDAIDTRDAQIAAAEKEKQANHNALIVKNRVTNPASVKKINEQYGITGDLAADPTAPTMANAALGRVDLGAPASKGYKVVNNNLVNLDDGTSVNYGDPVTRKVKKTVTDENNFIYNIYEDGKTENTGIKSIDYWTGKAKGSGTGKDIPKNYVPITDLNENAFANGGDLLFQLTELGATWRGKGDKLYVNKAKYDEYTKLSKTQIK